MTALRLVQRMKRDSMHYGRRPSGICGAGNNHFNKSLQFIIYFFSPCYYVFETINKKVTTFLYLIYIMWFLSELGSS